MQTSKEARTGREKLQSIIEMLTAIEAHGVDPFMLDVDDIIEIVREYFPSWEKPEDLNLDAVTIHHLASVINMQSEWVKHRSTSLYSDPFLLEDRIAQASKEEMVDLFLRSWHPIVELEQITVHSLAEALRYWETLTPMNERWKEINPNEVETEIASRDELIKQRVLGDKAFSEELEKFWQELKRFIEKKGKDGKISYWDFIGSETYNGTIERAFLTSFLITYGYATLEINPLEESVFIKPFDKPQTRTRKEQEVSVPIAVTYEDWLKWNRGEMD